MHVRRVAGVIALAIMALVAAGDARAGVSFSVISGPGEYFYATSLSADGTVVAGRRGGDYLASASIWTADTGITSVGFSVHYPAYYYRRELFVSPNGQVLGGMSEDRQAFRWTHEDGVQVLLGSPYASLSVATSFDGQSLIGYHDQLGAFHWTESTGAVALGRPAGLPSGRPPWAFALSHDGQNAAIAVPVTSTERATVYWWSPSTGFRPTGVETFVSRPNGNTMAISGDGSTIACTQRLSPNQLGRVVLLREGEEPLEVGLLDGDNWAEAWAASEDGSVIVGNSWPLTGQSRAFLWREDLGIVDLSTYVTQQGIDLTGWQLVGTRGVSADGTVIVGRGRHLVSGVWYDQSWIVTIPAPATGIAGLIAMCMFARRRRYESAGSC